VSARQPDDDEGVEQSKILPVSSNRSLQRRIISSRLSLNQATKRIGNLRTRAPVACQTAFATPPAVPVDMASFLSGPFGLCNLGVADWHGREAIRENLRRFIDKGLTAHHDVVEFWDSPLLKVFHGKVGMKFDDPNIKPVRPTMTHFFYMDEKAPTKVKHWIGAVGPTGF